MWDSEFCAVTRYRLVASNITKHTSQTTRRHGPQDLKMKLHRHKTPKSGSNTCDVTPPTWPCEFHPGCSSNSKGLCDVSEESTASSFMATESTQADILANQSYGRRKTGQDLCLCDGHIPPSQLVSTHLNQTARTGWRQCVPPKRRYLTTVAMTCLTVKLTHYRNCRCRRPSWDPGRASVRPNCRWTDCRHSMCRRWRHLTRVSSCLYVNRD
jgi:hypothetical protein